jgi:hypothetical protein
VAYPFFIQAHPLTGGSTSLTGAQTPLTGGSTSLTGAQTPLTGGSTSLTGAQTPLTGGSTSLTGAQTSLTGGEISLTGSSIRLTGCLPNAVAIRVRTPPKTRPYPPQGNVTTIRFTATSPPPDFAPGREHNKTTVGAYWLISGSTWVDAPF